ncbi:MAG: hypothetical protein ACLSB9_18815 [Hydrogeniiclostridium mannosilyticum]
MSVIRAGIFVDLFGLRFISTQRTQLSEMDGRSSAFPARAENPRKVLEVDRSDRNHVKATASVKQSGENPYEKGAPQVFHRQPLCGYGQHGDNNGVFVALDGGIDCLCSYPKRRPPRGSRVTVRILGINHDSNRIWGAITHIAAPR